MRKLERTKNATRSIFYGGILKVFQMIMPFAMRTAMIYYMGMEYLGLNSLFSSVLQVLNLAELGVGTAMVFAMYKPIAESDTNTICALMRLYKKYYRIIGVVILAGGLILTPAIPKLIKWDTIPADVNIYILYILNLAAIVLSYWFFAYKNSLLVAHQRNDIISTITICMQSTQYALQFGIIYFLRNYYYYLLALLFVQIVTNIVTAIIATKMYPEYVAVGELSREKTRVINGKIKDLFTAKLGSVILNSVDSIVISAFLGLTILAIYQNYYYILTSIIGFVTIIFNSCTAGLGNSFITESKDKNYANFMKFTFLISWLCGTCTVCFLCLYQPFMKLWVGEENMLSFLAVILLCMYYYVYEINQLLNTFKDAAGIWHEDRYRPLCVALINLFLNIVSVKYIGIYGIILSTVISILLVGMPWITHNLFTYIFKEHSTWDYVKILMKYSGTVFVAALISYSCCLCMPQGIAFVFIRLIICLIIPSVLFVVLYHNTTEFAETISLIKKIIIRKRN